MSADGTEIDSLGRRLKSVDELAKAIAGNKDKPDLLRDKMVFTKVKN